MIYFQKYSWVLLIFCSVNLSALSLVQTAINYTAEHGLAGNEMAKSIEGRLRLYLD